MFIAETVRLETSSVRSGMGMNPGEILVWWPRLEPKHAAPDGAWMVFRVSCSINMALVTELSQRLIPARKAVTTGSWRCIRRAGRGHRGGQQAFFARVGFTSPSPVPESSSAAAGRCSPGFLVRKSYSLMTPATASAKTDQTVGYFRRRKINSAAAPKPAKAIVDGSGTPKLKLVNPTR
jgi:hypothetical protein